MITPDRFCLWEMFESFSELQETRLWVLLDYK